MADRPVPARIARAVELIDVAGDASVLELGCGTGVALALVASRLTTGRVVGLDRSPDAVASAAQRLRDGGFRPTVATALQGSVADAGAIVGDRRFDVVFAVNVNVFWTDPSGPEADVVRELVADDGVLWLFYDGPSEGKAGNICARIADSLPERGYSVTTGGDDVVSWVRAQRA